MTHHKKLYRVLVYLAILGAVGTGATYAKYVSQVGSARESAKVAGFNVTAKLETSNANMSTGTVAKTAPNKANFTYTIKETETQQQMKVTFTNNSKVWVRPTVTGTALAYTSINVSDFSNSVIKQGESKEFVFNVSSTGGTDKVLTFDATQVLN